MLGQKRALQSKGHGEVDTQCYHLQPLTFPDTAQIYYVGGQIVQCTEG